MNQWLALSFALLLATVCPVQGGDKKKDDDPLPRKEAILKGFVDEFVSCAVPPGVLFMSFDMGSTNGDKSEQPVHPVGFMRAFSMAKYEVTQELYHVVMGKNPAKWKGPRNSVEMVNWQEANEFCKLATKELRERKLLGADEIIRLPSEAEWEYACRAGTKTAWSFGDDVKAIGDYSWYKVNAPGNDPPVGRKKGNAWGLHEMHGYVSEWCLDTWHPTYEGAPKDGSAWIEAGAKEHIIRGGSFADEPDVQRSAARQHVPSETRSDKLGFRCVRGAANATPKNR